MKFPVSSVSINASQPISTIAMYRRTASAVPRITQQVTVRPFTVAKRNFAESSSAGKGSENSTPGWQGRPGEDHVLHRDGNDAQSAPSKQAREQKEQGQGGSNAISQKDERNSNQKAKDDHPEAPGPVIGMNSRVLPIPCVTTANRSIVNEAQRAIKSS